MIVKGTKKRRRVISKEARKGYGGFSVCGQEAVNGSGREKLWEPLQNFSGRGTEFASKFKKSSDYEYKFKKGRDAKVNIKPKEGWKLIELASGGVLIKNKSRVDVSYAGSYVEASFQNKKTGEVSILSIAFGMGKNRNL